MISQSSLSTVSCSFFQMIDAVWKSEKDGEERLYNCGEWGFCLSSLTREMYLLNLTTRWCALIPLPDLHEHLFPRLHKYGPDVEFYDFPGRSICC